MKTTIKDVHNVYEKTLYIENHFLLDTALAIYQTIKIPGDPVWFVPVAPSGYGKSTIIKPLIKLANYPQYPIMFLSELTAASITSGSRQKDTEDIGAQLDGKDTLIIFNDFATIQTIEKTEKTHLMGKMRELYDGHSKKDTGSKCVNYDNIHVSMIGFCTPGVRRLLDEQSILGTREISCNMPRMVDPKQAMGYENTEQHEKERDQIIKRFIDDNTNNSIPGLSTKLKTQLKHYADRICKERAVPITNYQGEVVANPEVEYPMRVYKQLTKLAVGYKMIGIDEDKALLYIKKIASSVAPRLRNEILNIFEDTGIPHNTYDLANELFVAPQEIRKELFTLGRMGILKPMVDSKTELLGFKEEPVMHIGDPRCPWVLLEKRNDEGDRAYDN